MTIYLIRYNRKRGQVISQQTFSDSDRERANASRLALEKQIKAEGIRDEEVVLLEAATEGRLRETHARYFIDLAEIAGGRP